MFCLSPYAQDACPPDGVGHGGPGVGKMEAAKSKLLMKKRKKEMCDLKRKVFEILVGVQYIIMVRVDLQ